MADYNKNDIIATLLDLGVESGDTLFSHANLGFLGRLEGARNSVDYYQTFKSAVFEVIGKEGTWVHPTFTYSFCKQKVFDLNNTPGVCGALSEMARKDDESLRSEDANFSVVALGAKANFLLDDVSNYSFGENSFWDRFLKVDGKFLNFNFDSGSTFIHYVERTLDVPYRFDKGFAGLFVNNDVQEQREYYHYCHSLDKGNHVSDFTKFDRLAKAKGISKCLNLGKGSVLIVTAQDTFTLIKEQLVSEDDFLIVGPL